MAEYDLPAPLFNLISDLEKYLPFGDGMRFRDLWDKRYLCLAHIDRGDDTGRLSFSPDADHYRPLDAIWQLYALLMLVDEDVGLRPLVKDESIAKRMDQSVPLIRRWFEGDPPRSEEWDEVSTFSDEEAEDEQPLSTPDHAAISLLFAGGGLLASIEVVCRGAAESYLDRPIPPWAGQPLKSQKDGLFSRLINAIRGRKRNADHLRAQANWLLRLLQLRWTPLEIEEEVALYRLLAGDLDPLPDYQERLRRAFVEPEEIDQMTATIRQVNALLGKAGVQRLAPFSGSAAMGALPANGIPLAIRNFEAPGRESFTVSLLEQTIRDDGDLPEGLAEQVRAWFGTKASHEEAVTEWAKLLHWIRQQGYRETDRSLSRRVFERPATEGRTEYWIVELSRQWLYSRFGFLPPKRGEEFWGEWESTARQQQRSFSSTEEAMDWHHAEVARRTNDGFVEIFPRSTYFSDPADLPSRLVRPVNDPGIFSDTFIEPDTKAAQWVQQLSRSALRPKFTEGDGPPTGSRVSGPAWLKPGESWPACPTCQKPMALLVQLQLDSLPDDARERFGSGLLQFFECLGQSSGCDAKRTSLTAACRLVRILPPDSPGKLTTPPGGAAGPSFAITSWESPTADYPEVNDYLPIGYREEVGHVWHEDDHSYEILARQYRVTYGDKLGGWPYWYRHIDAEDRRCVQCQKPLQLILQLTNGGPLAQIADELESVYVLQCPQHKEAVHGVCH